MNSPDGERADVPISAEPRLDLPAVVDSQVFRNWVKEVDKDPKLFINDIHVQSLDKFGKRVGFIKFRSNAVVNVGGDKGLINVPGGVFMRGGSIAVLLILNCDGEDYTVLTLQARVPVGHHALPEIPAGMLDGTGNFKGAAADEIAEECNIAISEGELIDLTSLTYGDEFRGMLPSPGGCDEFIRLYTCTRTVERSVLKKLQGRMTGLLAEGEHISLQIVPLADLWRCTPDAKALSALTLFERLKLSDRLPRKRPKGITAAEIVQPDQEEKLRQERISHVRSSSAIARPLAPTTSNESSNSGDGGERRRSVSFRDESSVQRALEMGVARSNSNGGTNSPLARPIRSGPFTAPRC